MDLLGYSSSEGEDDALQDDAPAPAALAPRPRGDTDTDSSEESFDSATLRAQKAASRLRDFGEEASSSGRPLLPAAGAFFSVLNGPPSYLDPEATRQIAASDIHGREPRADVSAEAPKVRAVAGPDFDISLLAPMLPGGLRPGEKRLPVGAVIEGKAKRYKEDGGAGQVYTAAQIAIMGGNVNDEDASPPRPGAARPPGAGGAGAGAAAPGPRKPSKAQGVSEFLDRGGGALLPRKAQDRKDKEKLKREAGQSARGSWKTEAEMVLRQQYDS